MHVDRRADIWWVTSQLEDLEPVCMHACTCGLNSARRWCVLPVDSVVLVLTLYRAITSNRNTRGSMCTLWKLIVRDGMYFLPLSFYYRNWTVPQLKLGIAYFMIILASDLANVLAFLVSTLTWAWFTRSQIHVTIFSLYYNFADSLIQYVSDPLSWLAV